MLKNKFFNRELSWLSFNHRVLQESMDETVPLYERIKFLAIFSSNLDEFFRVRVSSLRSLLSLKKKTQKALDFDPQKLLNKIHTTVTALQETYGDTFWNKIKPELEKNNVSLVDHTMLNEVQKEYVTEFFNLQVLPHIMPTIIVKKKLSLFLRNQRLYLTVKLVSKDTKKPAPNKPARKHRPNYAIVEIPTNHLPRFIVLPKTGDKFNIIFLDDIIRFSLPQIFHGYNIISSYSVKLTRDAELYIDDEFSGDLVSKIRKGLQKRSTGVPCRFLYDKEIPKNFLRFLKDALFLSKDDLFLGGKYHNFSDFFNFPNPGIKGLNYPEIHPLNHREFGKYENIFDAVSGKDFFFHFPYQSYNHIINSLKTAAEDPEVRSIKITLYRIAKNSRIVHYLVKAAHRGKDVTAFVEIKARFDEEINISSAEEMQRAGVKVLYSLPGLKVHAKMCLISRTENGEIRNYGYLSTGNFNEFTARIYSDWGFFTADSRLTSEMEKVFDHLEGKKINPEFENLLVAQFNMRKVFTGLIDNEIEQAKQGKKASIILKLNSIQDEKIISKLYEASNAGVNISMIVRGVCCLKPGVKGLSENIEIISIIDRFLEHGRVFIFYNGGYEKVFVSSADWMKRNLSRRIETAFPIYDENIKQEIKDIIRIQFKDNTKARIMDKKQENRYKRTSDMIKHRAQYETYEYLKYKD